MPSIMRKVFFGVRLTALTTVGDCPWQAALECCSHFGLNNLSAAEMRESDGYVNATKMCARRVASGETLVTRFTQFHVSPQF